MALRSVVGYARPESHGKNDVVRRFVQNSNRSESRLAEQIQFQLSDRPRTLISCIRGAAVLQQLTFSRRSPMRVSISPNYETALLSIQKEASELTLPRAQTPELTRILSRRDAKMIEKKQST